MAGANHNSPARHVHLVLVPQRTEALARLLREVQMRYSQYRHALEQGNGHLWQGRYYSCAFEPARLGAVMRYVELNPVRARMVRDVSSYLWSSAAAHLGAPDRFELLSLAGWKKCWPAEEWRMILESGDGDPAEIREATYTGRPFGSEGFVARLERHFNRRLRRGQPGRPKKIAVGIAQAATGEI